MELLPSGADSAIQLIIREAYALFKLYRARDGERKTFAMLPKQWANVPAHAEPVVRELGALVGVASDKLSKYDSRSAAASLWNIRSETERMRTVMQKIQQLLPLLTVSVASAANVSTAVAELQSRAISLQDSSCEAAVHLSHLQATVESMASTTVTVADIQQCMATMHDSMLQLNADSTQKVVEGCVALQLRLGEGLEQLMDAVDVLQLTVDSFSRQMLTMQREMSADIEQIKGCLERFCGMPAGAAASMQSGRILEALDELDEAADGETPASNETLAAALKEAISKGRLAVTACLVLGVPLMPEGPLRPVTLPCCGFAVSHTGAQQLVRDRQCTLCHAPLAEDALLEENETVSKVVSAESHGYAPRLVRSSDVTMGKRLGAGGEGTVQEGWLGGRRIAVKQVPLPAGAGAKEMAAVKQVVSTSYIAGVASPHVCKLHGYCWTDSELWLLMEVCEGSLADLVPRAKQQCKLPGLPPLDLVTLGLMLCSALDAVHRSARCLHLDVTPGNILLAPSSKASKGDGGDGDAAQHSVRLADFGLAKRLPTCVRSSITTAMQTMVKGVAKGTPGYASKEQLLGNAQRRSDVYSMGATLLYAATGAHPYGGDTLEAILAKLFSGLPIPVPTYVEPPALKQLITSMTAIEAADRPSLASVQQQLMQMQATFLAEGCSTRFIAFGDRHVSVGMRAQPPLLGLASNSDGGGSHARMQSAADRMKEDHNKHAPSELRGCPAGGNGGALLDLGHPRQQSLAVVSEPVTDSTLKTSEPAAATSTSDPTAHTRTSQQSESQMLSMTSSASAGGLEPSRSVSAHAESVAPAGIPAVEPSCQRQLKVSSQAAAATTSRASALSSSGTSTKEQAPATERSAQSRPDVRQDVTGIHSIGKLFSRLALSSPGHVFHFGGRHSCTQQPLPLKPEDSMVWGRDVSHLLHRHNTELGKTSGWRTVHEKLELCLGVALKEGGAVVDNVRVQLGQFGAIVLEGSSNTVFRNCLFQGGFIICEGPKCCLKLQNVTLDHCKLIVNGGATAELRATKACFSGTSLINTPAVLVKGMATSLLVSKANIFAAATPAIAVEGGATLIGDWMHVHGLPGPHGRAELSSQRAEPMPAYDPRSSLTEKKPGVSVRLEGLETLAQLKSLSVSHPGRTLNFPVTSENRKQPLTIAHSSVLHLDAVRMVASVLGLKHGKMKAPGAKSSLREESGPEQAGSGFLQLPMAASIEESPEAQRGVVLSQHRMTVSNACLQLGQTGIIMLMGTSEIVLKGVDIQGGLLFCSGHQCRLVLEDVALHDCMLVVSGGAHATVRHTTVTMTWSMNADFRDHGVLVTGAGSMLDAEDLAVHAQTSGSRGIAVEAGGAVTAVRTHVNREPDLIQLW